MGRVSNAKETLMSAVLELIWQGSYGATTIDQICERANVKKGSFYYFFDSKSDLAAAALEMSWQKRKPEMDSIFPRRLRRWNDSVGSANSATKNRSNSSVNAVACWVVRSLRLAQKSAIRKKISTKKLRKFWSIITRIWNRRFAMLIIWD